jgi:hypothetical protein
MQLVCSMLAPMLCLLCDHGALGSTHLVNSSFSTGAPQSLLLVQAAKLPLSICSFSSKTSTPLSTSAIRTSSRFIDSSFAPEALISASSISIYSTALNTFLLNRNVGSPGNCPPRKSHTLEERPRDQEMCKSCMRESVNITFPFVLVFMLSAERVGVGRSGGGWDKFRNDIPRRFWSFERSLSICFGILHVQGTTLLSNITTNGVNSPHMRNTSPNTGTLFVSWAFLTSN